MASAEMGSHLVFVSYRQKSRHTSYDAGMPLGITYFSLTFFFFFDLDNSNSFVTSSFRRRRKHYYSVVSSEIVRIFLVLVMG